MGKGASKREAQGVRQAPVLCHEMSVKNTTPKCYVPLNYWVMAKNGMGGHVACKGRTGTAYTVLVRQ